MSPEAIRAEAAEVAQVCAQAARLLPEALWRPALERFRAFRSHLNPASGAFQRSAWDAWMEELKASAARLEEGP